MVIAPATPRPAPSPRAQAVLDAFEPPPIAIPDNPTRPHRIVRDWLAQNREARRAHKRDGWGTPPLDLREPLQDRRLRLYAALITALETAKFKIEAGTTPDHELNASKAGETIEFRLYERGRKGRRPLTEDEKTWSWNAGKTDAYALLSAGDLILKIKTYTRGAMAEDYRDQKAPLEQQLPKIRAAFEAGIVELQAWRDEQAQAAEQRQQDEIARARRAERERVVKERRVNLLEEAGRWRQASDLRAYVAAALATPAASDVDYSAWAAWALREADAIDPLSPDGPDLRFPVKDGL